VVEVEDLDDFDPVAALRDGGDEPEPDPEPEGMTRGFCEPFSEPPPWYIECTEVGGAHCGIQWVQTHRATGFRFPLRYYSLRTTFWATGFPGFR